MVSLRWRMMLDNPVLGAIGKPPHDPVDAGVYVFQYCDAIWATGEEKGETGKHKEAKSPRADKRECSVLDAGVNGSCEVDESDEE